MSDESNSPAEYDSLLSKVGVWDVDCSYFMGGPGCESIRARGVDHVEAIGGFWIVGRFECELPGTVINGRATTGYDPEKGCYLGTWFDSANPFLYYFEGQLSDDGQQLEMEGDNIDPTTRNLVKYRSVEERTGTDTRTLRLFVETAPGQEIQILEYLYTRRS